MLQHSETIGKISEAIAKAQVLVENADKDSNNPAFRSKYASLAEILNTVRPVFAKHGIAITQHPQLDSGVVTVTTLLSHGSGEWMSSDASVPVGKHDAHGVGSAITYARRYSLAAVTGITQEDDDANGAVGTIPKPAPAKAAPPTPTPTPTTAFTQVKEDTIERLAEALGDRTSAIVMVNKAIEDGRARGLKAPDMIKELVGITV